MGRTVARGPPLVRSCRSKDWQMAATGIGSDSVRADLLFGFAEWSCALTLRTVGLVLHAQEARSFRDILGRPDSRRRQVRCDIELMSWLYRVGFSVVAPMGDCQHVYHRKPFSEPGLLFTTLSTACAIGAA